MTVIADYFTGRVVRMGYGGDKATLNKFFSKMTAEQKKRIEAVAMDMWDAYISCVQHHCPQARIVFDMFHLVQTFGRVIDNDWCGMAGKIHNNSARAFVRQLRRYEYGILNHADYPIGAGPLEGINNKIKVIKRKAYGFHDSEYFVLKVKQAFAA